MPITPDTKNWTWVLERPCDECGYDAAAIRPGEVAQAVRDNADAWPPVLARPDARVRPDDDTWSALEYGAHVRDVLRLYRARLAMMMEQDDPLYPNWDQDATAVDDAYNAQDPAVVARELGEAASALAADFDAVTDAGWQRPGRRSDGVEFTVDTFARYFLHDLVHHLTDVRG
jgi:hypothetical protein